MDIFGTATISGDETSAAELRVHDLINSYRVSNGRTALTLDASLSAVANRHALDLLQNVRTLTHDWSVPSGFGVFQVTVAENAGGGQGFRSITPEAIYSGWINSAGHNANILNAGNRSVGYGYATDGQNSYWVQVFHSFTDPTAALDIDYSSHLWNASVGSAGSYTGDERRNNVTGSPGAETILGLDGDDVIFGGGGADYLSGNRGNDRITWTSGNVTAVGGQGADTIIGQGNLNGNLGDDSIVGSGFNDILYGGRDNDTILAGNGDDTILGNRGDDLLAPQSGADLIYLEVDGGIDRVQQWNAAEGDRISAPGQVAVTFTSDGTIVTYANSSIILLGTAAWDSSWLVIS